MGDVVRSEGEAFLQRHPMTGYQKYVFRRLGSCRSGMLGYHMVICDHCRTIEWKPIRCSNRHCPDCGGSESYRWVSARRSELLGCSYYQINAQLPRLLRGLARENSSAVYNLLYRASRQAIVETMDLGTVERPMPGLLQNLHTWNRSAEYLPHVHNIVGGVGWLHREQRWAFRQDGASPYDVEKIGPVFLRKLVSGLRSLYKRGELSFHYACNRELSEADTFSGLMDQVLSSKPRIWSGRPHGGKEQLLRYFARSQHQVALRSIRFERLENRELTYSWTTSKGLVRRKTVRAEQFLLKYRAHILPSGFNRIRRAGMLSPRKIKMLRDLGQLECPTPPGLAEDSAESEGDESTTAVESAPVCGHCRKGRTLLVTTLRDVRDDRRIPPRCNGPPGLTDDGRQMAEEFLDRELKQRRLNGVEQ